MKVIALILAAIGTLTLSPGQQWTNGDSVSVDVFASSPGAARMFPKSGNPFSATRVYGRMHGEVNGIDANDTVTLWHGSRVRVRGTGGLVRIGSKCRVEIHNTGTAGPIDIELPPPYVGIPVQPGQTWWVFMP